MVSGAPSRPEKALLRCQPSMPFASAMTAASPVDQQVQRLMRDRQCGWAENRLAASASACVFAHEGAEMRPGDNAVL
jgi:hypothetical protein